jgi:hypothetical protein
MSLKKVEIPRLLAEGMSVAEVAAALGTTPRYVRSCATQPVKPRKPGPPPTQQRQSLGPWAESIGRWLEAGLNETGTLSEVSAMVGIDRGRLNAAMAGTVDLRMSELLRLSVTFRSPLPAVTTTRPTFSPAE